MNISELQQRLTKQGSYSGNIDGDAGPATRAAILKFLTDGPDFGLAPKDYTDAAAELGVPESYVKALYEIESSGSPFIDGRPAILPEPHRFSKATGHRFDAAHPRLSYPKWDRTKYPRTQAARYDQLIAMICLDPLAGFGSASYGGFQIMGENYARCGAQDTMSFAWTESQTVADQLTHFVRFIKSDAALHRALKAADWATVALRYNGTGYRANRYDVRLAQAQRKFA